MIRTARASSSWLSSARAVSRKREIPSGTEGGRKHPTRRPRRRHSAAQRKAGGGRERTHRHHSGIGPGEGGHRVRSTGEFGSVGRAVPAFTQDAEAMCVVNRTERGEGSGVSVDGAHRIGHTESVTTRAGPSRADERLPLPRERRAAPRPCGRERGGSRSMRETWLAASETRSEPGGARAVSFSRPLEARSADRVPRTGESALSECRGGVRRGAESTLSPCRRPVACARRTEDVPLSASGRMREHRQSSYRQV